MVFKQVVLGICVVLISGPGFGGEFKLLAKEQYTVQKKLRVEHVARVDTNRLRTINVGLDQLVRNGQQGGSAHTVLRGLSAIETSLLGLRLQPQDVSAVHDRIKCVRAAVQQAADFAQCKSTAVSKANTEAFSFEKVPRLASTNNTVGLFLSEDERRPLVVALYGHSVDVDIGRFFLRLAQTNPDLLQPIPIDRNYQRASCVSGSFPGLVTSDTGKADRAFRELLENASALIETSDNAWRFTLSQGALAEKRARAGVDVPDTLAAFRLDDALLLITADFSQRFGMRDVDAEILAALRNVWTVLGDDRFRVIMADALGVKQLNPSDLGAFLGKRGLSNKGDWGLVFGRLARALHCNDADKVLQAYGLVYRKGDYPSANQVLKLLDEKVGYAAVPGVSISQTKRSFLEASPQNCALFGPVEQGRGGDKDDLCNVRQIDVDGRSRWEVIAGGAAIQFFVSDEQHKQIISELRAYASEPREGGILRWRTTSRVDVASQTQVFALPRDDSNMAENELPCIISLSRTGTFDGTEDLKGHIHNYREHFYPKGDPLSPDTMSYVYILDEFGGHTKKRFRQNMEITIRSLTETYKNLLPQLSAEDGGSSVGATHLPASVALPLCIVLGDQINTIMKGPDISHGAFIKTLLIGGRDAMTNGVGLLNPEGQFGEADFDEQFRFWDNEGNLANVAENIKEAREEYQLAEAANNTGTALGVGVFNLSLGKSYLHVPQEEFDIAKDVLNVLKDEMALWHEKGLFVVAAGQPPLGGEETEGLELQRTPARDVALDTSECSFFPACLSERKNVITVGAVRPSASAQGHRRPVLIGWANHGSAVSVAGPGSSVLAKEFGYIHGEDASDVTPLPTTSVRDGTSVSTVFVTALAARLAAEHPALLASEIKKRLISTAKPYLRPQDSNTVLFAGDEGDLYAGVIDPEAALLDPTKVYIRWRKTIGDTPKIQEFDSLLLPDETVPLTIFTTARERGKPKLKCRWRELYRIHIEDDFRESEGDPPLYKGAIACKNEVRGEIIDVGTGPFGTQVSNQQNKCLIDGNCFQGVANGQVVDIDLANVRDIYFPVVGR